MRGRGSGPKPPEDGGAASDAALVRAALRDGREFAPLYVRYRDDIERYCFFCLEDWRDAEEAAQEIFASALRDLARLRNDEGAFRRWLFRIAHNEVYDRQKLRRRWRFAPLEDAFALSDPSPSPEQIAIASDAHDRLVAFLRTLPDRERKVCELRLTGLTNDEIAHALDLENDGAIRTAWSRAAKRTKEWFGIARTGKGGGDG